MITPSIFNNIACLGSSNLYQFFHHYVKLSEVMIKLKLHLFQQRKLRVIKILQKILKMKKVKIQKLNHKEEILNVSYYTLNFNQLFQDF